MSIYHLGNECVHFATPDPLCADRSESWRGGWSVRLQRLPGFHGWRVFSVHNAIQARVSVSEAESTLYVDWTLQPGMLALVGIQFTLHA